ncbi:MAG: hypothetical protein ACR2Q4_17315 [Geminicoccaceae bacterium]
MTTAETSTSRPPGGPLEIASAEMAAGERLIWAETSLPGNAKRRIWPLSLLGWLFLLLCLTWMVKAFAASFWLVLMGLPFIAASLGFALMPWWWPSYTRHVVYAISDRRLLIIRDWPRRRVTSYGPDDIDVVERRERGDGSGDVIFRREEHRKLRHHHDPQGKRRVGEREIGFFGVPDVRQVEDAIWSFKEQRGRAEDTGPIDPTDNGEPTASPSNPPLPS